MNQAEFHIRTEHDSVLALQQAVLIYRGALEVLNVPLKTGADVETGSLSQRAMDAGFEYAAGLFRKYVTKQ